MDAPLPAPGPSSSHGRTPLITDLNSVRMIQVAQKRSSGRRSRNSVFESCSREGLELNVCSFFPTTGSAEQSEGWTRRREVSVESEKTQSAARLPLFPGPGDHREVEGGGTWPDREAN
jgi:hypothetical protein